jgi:AraC-like DNA-binding protein
LKRAVDYIEDHLDRPLSLADIASSAGITRMYFAAQFRAATGLRPHEYLLRRRIERAQKLLIQTPAPLVEVALAVGFQTQSHFTTVFTRYTRQTPSVWRMLHCGTKRRFEEGSALDLPPPSHARGSEAVSVNTAWLCS